MSEQHATLKHSLDFISAIAAIALGSVSLSPAAVWDALRGRGAPDAEMIVRVLRLPRVVLGIVVGAGLGMSGAALQANLRNALAEPYLLGVSGGAGLGAAMSILIGGAFLGAVGLPVRLRSIGGDNRRTWNAAKLIEHMRGDKKAEAGRLTFILAHGIGKAFVTRDVEEKALGALLDRAIAA